jgi:hypothetical protein
MPPLRAPHGAEVPPDCSTAGIGAAKAGLSGERAAWSDKWHTQLSMRTIEIRRHSYTKQGEAQGHGSHLSADGVRLAREVGAQIGPFAYVAASVVPRTVETAIAMGFAVDDLLDFGGGELWEKASATIEHAP